MLSCCFKGTMKKHWQKGRYGFTLFTFRKAQINLNYHSLTRSHKTQSNFMLSFNFKRNVLKSVMFCGLLLCAGSLSATTSHTILSEEEAQPTDEVIATGYDRQANVNCILYKSGYLEVYSSGGNSYLSSIGFMIGSDKKDLIKTVSIKEIRTIQDDAFADCKNLTSVTFYPNDYKPVRKISGNAFRNCVSLKSITIPASVHEIERRVFEGCTSLESIVVEEGNSTYDSRDNCNAVIETATNTLKIGLSSTKIPNTVTTIGGGAFEGTTLKSIVIPEGVTLIENEAFKDCKSLEAVSLPNSLERIYPFAFRNSNISSISIPVGVKYISEDVFDGCNNLSTITVSNGNTKYDSRDNCNALIETATNTILRGSSSTVIPNSVTTIGRNAFRGSKIAKIVIPASVKNIGQWAFQDCKSLTTVVCKSKSVIDVSGLLPFDPLPNATLYVPAESIEAYKAANEWSKFSNIQPLPYADINITAAGKTTYCSSYALDFTNVEGVKAYLALGFSPSTGVVFLTRVNKIPAGVGFMIFGKEGQYEVPFCETDITYANLMVGTKSETTVASTADGKTNYVLANGVDGVMFYLANDAVVPANKAYLSIPSSVINTPAKVIRLGFEDDMTTGILRVEDMTNKTDNKIYGLDGRRKASLSSGFNIVNGKKIYVK